MGLGQNYLYLSSNRIDRMSVGWKSWVLDFMKTWEVSPSRI